MNKNAARKSVKERLDLWNRAMNGDTKALIKLSLERQLISKEDLDEFERIEKFHKNCDSKSSSDS